MSDPKTTEQAKTEKKEKAVAAKFKKYRTRDTSSVLFDMLIRGTTIYGAWVDGKKHVSFDVPLELVEPFERHYDFQSGRLIPEPEPTKVPAKAAE